MGEMEEKKSTYDEAEASPVVDKVDEAIGACIDRWLSEFITISYFGRDHAHYQRLTGTLPILRGYLVDTFNKMKGQ